MSVWSICLEYDEPRVGDITRLTYTSANDLVTFRYRIPFTGAHLEERDHGIRRFLAIRSIIGRKPIRKTSWRKHPKSPNAQASATEGGR